MQGCSAEASEWQLGRRRSWSMVMSYQWCLTRFPLICSNLAGAVSVHSTWRVGISCFGGVASKGHAGWMYYGVESKTTWRGSGEWWEGTSKTTDFRVWPLVTQHEPSMLVLSISQSDLNVASQLHGACPSFSHKALCWRCAPHIGECAIEKG